MPRTRASRAQSESRCPVVQRRGRRWRHRDLRTEEEGGRAEKQGSVMWRAKHDIGLHCNHGVGLFSRCSRSPTPRRRVHPLPTHHQKESQLPAARSCRKHLRPSRRRHSRGACRQAQQQLLPPARRGRCTRWPRWSRACLQPRKSTTRKWRSAVLRNRARKSTATDEGIEERGIRRDRIPVGSIHCGGRDILRYLPSKTSWLLRFTARSRRRSWA